VGQGGSRSGKDVPYEHVWWRVVPVVGKGGECEGRKTMNEGEKEGRTAINTNCCRMVREGRCPRGPGRKEGRMGEKEGGRRKGMKGRK
jgi:hypothetical protein